DLQSKLDGYNGLDDAVANVNDLAEQVSYITRCRQDAQRVQRWMDGIITVGSSIKKLQKATSEPLPETSSMQDAEQKFEVAFRLAERLREKGREYKSLLASQKVVVPEADDLTT